MFDGSVVDVAIGVILLFFVSSLLASALVEIVGGFLHRRSKNLWDSLELMLGGGNASKHSNDSSTAQKLVDEIYRQPFVTTLVQPKAQRYYPTGAVPDPPPGTKAQKEESTRGLRSYKSTLGRAERKRRFHGPQRLSSRDFSDAFIEALEPGGTVDQDVDALKRRLEELPDAIKKPLGSVLSAATNTFDGARTKIEEWYERHMNAVSVWYRRQTRYFLFIAGLVLAIAGNLDAISATRTLYSDKAVRDAVVAQAQTIGESECSEKKTAQEKVDCLRKEVGGAVSLPVGWTDIDRSADAWILRVLGWLLVAGAVTLGAPFWFDLFRRALAHRKATAAR